MGTKKTCETSSSSPHVFFDTKGIRDADTEAPWSLRWRFRPGRPERSRPGVLQYGTRSPRGTPRRVASQTHRICRAPGRGPACAPTTFRRHSRSHTFDGPHGKQVLDSASVFYKKYYDDGRPRRLALGSSPARRGSAITGVPFVGARELERACERKYDGYATNKGAQDFLDEIVLRYGGPRHYYADLLMAFVCPLGISGVTPRGRVVNANYYDSGALLEILRPFVVSSPRQQVDLGIDTSTCYCIGSGENFRFLSSLNEHEGLFDMIVPLEHPRFVVQYNPARRDEFVEKYVAALRAKR